MVLLLIPLAAFFSAVCLALAVLARSMKEGQYYMTPLYLVCLPLIFLTLAPGIELNLFYSLVPITGVALLLRALILGNYDVACRFFLPGAGADGRLRRRSPCAGRSTSSSARTSCSARPSGSTCPRGSGTCSATGSRRRPAARRCFCFALILTSSWFLMQYLACAGQGLDAGGRGRRSVVHPDPPAGDGGPADLVARADAPALTGRSRGTSCWPWRWPLTLNPLVNELQPIVEWLFPISPTIKDGARPDDGPGRRAWASPIVVFALIPAVCEEFAFRGFILSGLERQHRTRSAILLSALLFGFLHVLLSLFQQLFNATLLGIVLGLLAVRSRSILPGIVFHFLNNALAVARGYLVESPRAAADRRLDLSQPGGGLYHGGWIAASVLLSGLLLFSLWKWKSGASRPVGRAANPRPVEPACRLDATSSQPGMTRDDPSPLRHLGRWPGETLDETRHAHPPGAVCLPGRGAADRGRLPDDRAGPRIGWVGPASERRGDLDLGNVAIVPGFVNAHTHLELAPLGRPGRPSAAARTKLSWLRRVIEQRRGGSERIAAARRRPRTCEASIEAGTTLLADTTTAGLSWEPIAAAPLRRSSSPS